MGNNKKGDGIFFIFPIVGFSLLPPRNVERVLSASPENGQLYTDRSLLQRSNVIVRLEKCDLWSLGSSHAAAFYVSR
jgi:hypothetical protein